MCFSEYAGKGYWKGKGKGKGWKKHHHTKQPSAPTPIPSPTTPTIPPVTRDPASSPPPTPECNECRTGCLFITDFVLVDADQNLNVANPAADYLVTLEEGATYSLSDLQTQFGVTNWALLCVTDPLPFSQDPFEIGSVGMRDNIYRTHVGTAGNDSGKDYNSEGSPPYTLADDNSGDYNPTDFTLGTDWSITCQAFCESNLLGDESVAVTRTFTMNP